MENKETGLSTELAPAYEIKTSPKDLKLEIGKTYTISDAYGTKNVKITSIRQIDDEISIYYEYRRRTGKFWEDVLSPTYINECKTLNTFKAQLLQYGQVQSVNLLYPTKKKPENYYPTN